MRGVAAGLEWRLCRGQVNGVETRARLPRRRHRPAPVIFLLSKALWFIVRPSTLLLLLCCIGLGLTWTRRIVLGRRLLAVGLGGLVAIVFLPLGNALQLPLEDRFPRVEHVPGAVHGIIVLGGAVETPMTEERGLPSLNDAAERMTAMVGLARRYPDAVLAFTGGSGSVMPGDLSEAAVARMLWSDLGIDPGRVVFEDRSRTTYENAVLLKALVHPEPGQTWILVTSAFHMPRAVGIFRRVGWDVLPWPVAYKTGHEWRTWAHPPIGGRIDLLDNAVHEWVGLLAYRIMGRTSALFPAPGKAGP